ncbi:MAG TPA: hypothetical protein VLZ84_12980 [Asticcacaulis sp.]|nr:hypothetical protein [Asticcacaulis sp.]
MTDFDIKTDHNSGDGTHPSDVARGSGQSDPFPPEGTDEKIISPVNTGEDAISQDDSLKATKAALSYQSGGSEAASLIRIVTTFVSAFLTGFFRTTPAATCLRADKKLRDNLDESQIDSMIDDSFPASDPPSSY